jgi:5-methylcytosine-specific restriction protein A
MALTEYRKTTNNLYATGWWQRTRAEVLRRQPLCAECAKIGRVTPATEVDHIIPHRGKRELFFDRSNLQPLCHSCHSRKTAREMAGAGGRGL